MATTDNVTDLQSGDSDQSDSETPGPSKKARSGAATYKTKFSKAWIESYPFIDEIASKPHDFFCKFK